MFFRDGAIFRAELILLWICPTLLGHWIYIHTYVHRREREKEEKKREQSQPVSQPASHLANPNSDWLVSPSLSFSSSSSPLFHSKGINGSVISRQSQSMGSSDIRIEDIGEDPGGNTIPNIVRRTDRDNTPKSTYWWSVEETWNIIFERSYVSLLKNVVRVAFPPEVWLLALTRSASSKDSWRSNSLELRTV